MRCTATLNFAIQRNRSITFSRFGESSSHWPLLPSPPSDVPPQDRRFDITKSMIFFPLVPCQRIVEGLRRSLKSEWRVLLPLPSHPSHSHLPTPKHRSLSRLSSSSLSKYRSAASLAFGFGFGAAKVRRNSRRVARRARAFTHPLPWTLRANKVMQSKRCSRIRIRSMSRAARS